MTVNRRLSRTGIGTAAAIVSTAAVVVALAVIQYRWNQQASEATGVRLADSLQLSMVNWHLDLFRNLSEVALTMRPPADPQEPGDQYGRRFAEWRSLARYPDLVANVYVVRRTAADRIDITRAAPDAATLDRTRWPPVVERVVSHLDRMTSAAPINPQASGQLTESFYNIGSALRDWQFDPTGPALVRSTLHDREWLLVELNEDVLQQRILPELAQRYFQGIDGLDYEVAVVSGKSDRRVIYTSDPGFGRGGGVRCGRPNGRLRARCWRLRIRDPCVPSYLGESGSYGGGRRQLVSDLPRAARRR